MDLNPIDNNLSNNDDNPLNEKSINLHINNQSITHINTHINNQYKSNKYNSSITSINTLLNPLDFITLNDIQNVIVEYSPCIIKTYSDTYALYKVSIIFTQSFLEKNKNIKNKIIVMYRFNHFKKLKNKYGDLSIFPESSYTSPLKVIGFTFSGDLDPEYLKSRAIQLNIYCNKLLNHLKENMDSLNTIHFMNFLFSEESVYIPNKKDDLKQLLDLSYSWNKPITVNLWDKFVLSIFGITSSGKSSFINHLIGFPIRYTSSSQVDTKYTIIEFINKQDFINITKFNHNLLDKETVFNSDLSEDLFMDVRYNKLFTILNTNKTIKYYYPKLDVLKKYTLKDGEFLQTILINNEYLKYLPEEQARFLKSIIIIDTKGLEQNTINIFNLDINYTEAFVRNAGIRAEIKRISSFSLFLMSIQQSKMCQSQLYEFELTTLMASNKEQNILTLSKKIVNSLIQFRNNAEIKKLSLYYIGERSLNVVSPLFGVLGKLTNSALSVLRQVNDKVVINTDNIIDNGKISGLPNLMWGNMLFIFTKSDEINWTKNEDESFWYEVGKVFGQSLQHIEPPTKLMFLRIGLPEFANCINKGKINELDKLKLKIMKLSLSYVNHTIDEKIVNLADCLLDLLNNEVNNEGSNNVIYPVINKKYIDIEYIKSRSEERMKK